MNKVILVMAAVIGLSACEAYPGRTTNCWGGSALTFADFSNTTYDCRNWVTISD